LIVVYAVPKLTVKSDPTPKSVPGLATIRSVFQLNTDFNQTLAYKQIDSAVQIDNPKIKAIANYIATESCKTGGRICYAKALYNFVRDNIEYLNDPLRVEFIQVPELTLATGGGDCDDGAVLLASLLGSIGIRTEFVYKPNHVLLRAWLPEALKRYKKQDNWVYLDWTCNECEFGVVPPS
ncbi:hypothetical protein DRJ48_02320, partial [Candidatus Woesearchaeota archaeon]